MVLGKKTFIILLVLIVSTGVTLLLFAPRIPPVKYKVVFWGEVQPVPYYDCTYSHSTYHCYTDPIVRRLGSVPFHASQTRLYQWED